MLLYWVQQCLLLVSFSCTMLLQVPQLLHTYKTKQTDGFSTYTMVMRMLSSVCWFVYSILVSEWLIVASSVVTFGGEIMLMNLKFTYDKKQSIYDENENETDAHTSNKEHDVHI